MIILKSALPRRTVLRGMGAALALPFLESMVPALTAAASPPRRFSAVYVPNGVAMRHWTPATEGAGFELSSTLQALEPFRDQLLVLSGLNGTTGSPSAHAAASTRFLTCMPPKRSEYDLEAGISADQVMALHSATDTQLTSIELSLESLDVSGSCDVGFACAYTNTVSWRKPTTPLPTENNPRAVFERLFGDSGSTNRAVRQARIDEQQSLLDSLSEKVRQLQRGLGARDRARIGEYLEAVRDVERRIQKAEEQSASGDLLALEQPSGIPSSFENHAKLMFDLQVLAYQSDMTRVMTFMLGRELSGRTYPEVGVPDSHHPISHHQNNPGAYEKVAKINAYHVTMFTYYLEKLKSTPDGDGSLLDHMMLLYGSGIADPNAHDPRGLPWLLLGGQVGEKMGRHIVFKDTPSANLLLTLIHKFGVPEERFSNSNGQAELASL